MGDFNNMLEDRKIKSDGTPLRSKSEIALSYDTSNLPYPIKNFYNLDYCWKVTKMLVLHSFYMALPCSLFYTIATDKEKDFVATKNIHKWPFRR